MDETLAAAARTTVAQYTTYREAQRAVDFLSDQHFPVERVAIVAEGLRLVERVTGRLTWPRAMVNGAVSGGLIGLLLGWVAGLLNWLAPVMSGLVLGLFGLVFGAVVGGLLGLLSYLLTAGQRDFTSAGGLEAQRYLIVCDPEFAPKAADLLRRMAAGVPERATPTG